MNHITVFPKFIFHSIEIFKIRPRIFRNWIKQFNSENWLSSIIMLCLVGIFWFGGFFFFRYLAGFFYDIPTIGIIFINRMLAFLFLALFVMTVFSDLVTALSVMYLSRDLPFLHTYPVNPVSIFMEKYIQTVFYGAWAVVCFGIPIYFAYGSVMQAPWYFYPVILFCNIPFLIISAGIAILVTLLLAWLLPASRARTMIVALYGFSFIAVLLYIRMLGAQQMLGTNSEPVEQYLFNLKLTTNPFLPNYWITQVYISAAEGNLYDLFFYMILLTVTAGLVIQLGCQLAYYLYYSGWTKSSESVQGTVSRKKWTLDNTVYRLFHIFRPPVRAILIKDIKIFWRDLTQWGQFTILLTLVLVYLYNTRNVIQHSGFMNQLVFNLPLGSLIGLFNLALVGFVLANLAMRFVYTMISLEGRIIWIIRSAPITLSTLFWVKYSLALFTMILIGGGLILLANYLLNITPFVGILSLLAVILMSVSLTSLAMGLGSAFPTFQVENPMQLTTGTGSILTVVLSLIYLFAMIFLVAQPIIPYFLYGGNIGMIPAWSIYFPLICITIINFLTIYYPVKLGLNKLQKREN